MHWMTPTFEFSFGKLLDCTMLGTAPCLLRGLLYCALCLVSETWFLPANISHKLSAQNGGKLDSGSLPATCTHVRKGRTSGSPHGVGRPHAENRGRFFSGPVNCPMATTLESSWVLKGKEFLENTWVCPVENLIPNYLSNRRRPCRRDHGSPPN